MNGKEEAMVNTVVAHLDGLCKYCFTNRKPEEKCLKNLKPFFLSHHVCYLCNGSTSSPYGVLKKLYNCCYTVYFIYL